MNNYDYKDIGEFVNIGTGEDVKLRDLVMMIKEIAYSPHERFRKN